MSETKSEFENTYWREIRRNLRVDNLKVAGVNKMNNDWISLPKVYSKKTLPVKKEEVETPRKIIKMEVSAFS